MWIHIFWKVYERRDVQVIYFRGSQKKNLVIVNISILFIELKR